MSAPTSFDTLRVWQGSQDRAFEELAYQLLKDDAPDGSGAIRTGNPDGGVEWYATLPDGTEIGWQAKHTHGIDSLLSGMTNSVERVALERPNLRKLVFVISDNLSTSTQGGERLSARQKYENKTRVWRESIAGAEDIEFDVVQGSDLLAKLAQPKHRGRAWFWWDTTVLDDEWLRRTFRQQASAAGEKYRPDLQVDVPIQEDLAALGFSKSSLSRLTTLVRSVSDAIGEMSIPAEGDAEQAALYHALEASASVVQELLSRLNLDARSRAKDLGLLLDRIRDCSDSIGKAREREFHNRAKRDALERDDPARSAIGPMNVATGPAVGTVDEAIERLLAWLDSPQGKALLQPTYFLTGEAGSGKTHLYLDAVQRALSDGRPAIFLAGAQFGSALWSSFAEQLGLGGVGADEILDAFDSAGEASALEGRRFVIFIDAVNETPDSSFWSRFLPALRAAVAERPHVALAVSCRDTYLQVVAEDGELEHFLRRTHPGFAGRESEATSKFFAHYGLVEPRHPLLTPEFSLPLFLRIYCEASVGWASHGLGHHSRTQVFERYVARKVQAVARRIGFTVTSGFELDEARRQVETVLDSLLEELARTGEEAVATTDAGDLAQSALLGDRATAVRVLGALHDEGVLTRERVFIRERGRVDGMRIVFQAFSDFLVLRHRMSDVASPTNDAEFLRWLNETASYGVLEAASIVLPEAHGHELVDVLGIDVRALRAQWREADWDARKQMQRPRRITELFFKTLAHRSSDSVNQRSIDLLNEVRRHFRDADLFQLIFTLSAQPGHRLNGDGLHAHLVNIPMPKRDAYFGFATFNEVLDSNSPASRLARWAAGGPYPDYDPNVVELAAIPLCWLLGTSHRYQRDWVTKALVQLLRGHLDVASRLLGRFWGVNDPYIVQRVVVVAYGAFLRADPAETEPARHLAQNVLDTVFSQPVRADAVMLDAARSLIHAAVDRGLLMASALERTDSPLGISAPRRNPPTEASFKKKYGRFEGIGKDENWYSIFGSIFGMGDFGRYVVESAAHDYTTTPLGQPHPEIVRKPAPEPNKAAVARFMEALTPEQQALVPADFTEDALSRFRVQRQLALTESQRELYFAFTPRARASAPPRARRGDLARRWVMARTLSLGWTPDLFAERDSEISRWRSGREPHKPERWGKKYQWIALHEYVARLADNFRPSHDEVRVDFRVRDIDPSLPPIRYDLFAPDEETEEEVSTVPQWANPPTVIAPWPAPTVPFQKYGKDMEMFAADTATEPSLEELVRVTGVNGEAWLVLNGNLTQIDPRASERWRGLRQSASASSWLVPQGSGPRLASIIAATSRLDRFDLEDDQGHSGCCYLREVGVHDIRCGHRHANLEDLEITGHKIAAVSTTENYGWTGSGLDCSMGAPAAATAPSAFIQARMGLAFSDAGPSWTDDGGMVVFQNYWSPESEATGLVARGSAFSKFLATEKLDLVVATWFERMNLGNRRRGAPSREPYVTASQVAWTDSTLRFRSRSPVRKTDDVELY